MKDKLSANSKTKHIVTTEMPYINFDSPHVKEQIAKGNQIIKKIKNSSLLSV
jgi:nicotinic acid mononucleotide adenylyltransferase